MYTLRPATQSDQPAIRALIHAVGINPVGLDWRRFILAVDEQGEVIGCGQVKLHRDKSRELASIAVKSAWRRQGVAGAVIACLIEKHPGPLYLTCRASLGPFYERFGFRRIPTLENLPPSFRRLYRLAEAISRLGIIKEEMWVMKK